MIKNKISFIKKNIPTNIKIIVVSKNQSISKILNLYKLGHRNFGENKVQELVRKYEKLPKDISWHMIGKLQTNKVKYIIPFVKLIHSVDSSKLLIEINKRAIINSKIISVLIQIKISKDLNKTGCDYKECIKILEISKNLNNIKILGFMAIASNSDDETLINNEFSNLNKFFESIKKENKNIQLLSMGMSKDYKIAIKNGSNMIRLGSMIFS